MIPLETLIARVRKTTNGFTDIRRAADELATQESPADRKALAQQLIHSDVPQARMLATFLWGDLAAQDAEIMQFLRDSVSRDPDWRAGSGQNDVLPGEIRVDSRAT